MARNTITKTIDFGRDKGKRFIITEMAAKPGHAWATRVLFAMLNAGAPIAELIGAGVAGLAVAGIKAIGNVPHEVAAPLLDELLACVEYQPNPDDASKTRPLHEIDVEEMSTYFALQYEAFDLMVSPFRPVATSTSA